MKYIEIMVEYGDFYFRQNTLEMLPEAIKCYVEASHYFGPRQEVYDSPKPEDPQSYSTLPIAEARERPAEPVGSPQSWQADFESSFLWKPLADPESPIENIGLTLGTICLRLIFVYRKIRLP